MAQILRQSTQVIVRIGPAVAVGDGFTPVTTLDLSTADEAELLKANTTTTTSIAAATFAAITGCDGWYGLTLTTALTDTVGCLDVMVNDDSLILPIFARFQVIEEAAYDVMYAASAPGAASPTNITAGTITTATNVTTVNGLAANVITAAATAADFGTEIGTAVWATTTRQLTSAQTFDLTGSITGNLSGSVGSVTGAVGSVTGATGSVTGLTASDVGAIKAKTDSLTFTVAGKLDANVLVVNGVTVGGLGTEASPWGPA